MAHPPTPEMILAHQLTMIVSPNYPHLAGTTIPSIDAQACAARGTPEQRATGKEVRRIIEGVTELEEGHPLRLLLARLHAPLQPAEVGLELVRRAAARVDVYQLPKEIMMRILGKLITGRDKGRDDLELITFARFRLVSRSITAYIQQLVPAVLQRYVDRVAAHLLHVVGPAARSMLAFAKEAYEARPLFNRVTTLHVFFAGAMGEGLSALLRACDYLQTLVLFIDQQEPGNDATIGRFSGLDLSANSRLERLSLCNANVEDHGLGMELSRWEASDLQPCNRPADWLGLPWYARLEAGWEEEFFQAPRLPSLRTLHIKDLSTSALDMVCLMCPQVELVSANLCAQSCRYIGSAAAAGTLHTLGLAGCVFDDGGLRTIMVRAADPASTLTSLDISSIQAIDASALSLATNTTLLRLSAGYNYELEPAFGLASNRTLVFLDLTRTRRPGNEQYCQVLGNELANSSVQELILDHCYLDNGDLPLLQLATNRCLRKLSLQGNCLQNDGLAAALGLNSNTSLIEVLLAGNLKVTAETPVQLSTATRKVVGEWRRRSEETPWNF